MLIKKAEFIWGVVKDNQPWPVTVPQIAFYGRSNAGKSSSINAIVNRKSLAKSSSAPGKTRQINFFNINDNLYFVDLPGYGYAKMSKIEKDKLQDLIFWFMCDTHVNTRIHVVIVDAKLGIQELDREIIELLYRSQEPIIILLNKTDKLKQGEIAKSLSRTRLEVGPSAHVIPFSARTKKGVIEFWKVLNEIRRATKQAEQDAKSA
jgi:GTP-binding protein